MHVLLLYSGHQFDYLFGLVTAFHSMEGVNVIVIDAKRKDNLENQLTGVRVLKYLNLHKKSLVGKMWRWIPYFMRLFGMLIFGKYDVVHIEWFTRRFIKIEQFLIPFIVKLRGKKLVYKVHDISSDLLLNGHESSYQLNFTKSQKYFLEKTDKIMVHNRFVSECLKEHVDTSKLCIIPHGINNFVNDRGISKNEARKELRLPEEEKVVLFFGNLSPYKNLESLVRSIGELRDSYEKVNLVIAGAPRAEHITYFNYITELIDSLQLDDVVFSDFNFIAQENVEYYFKASDVLVLPYRFIFQSGVLFLAYRFGTPVIAHDVGGISEDIIPGETGLLYKGEGGLAHCIKEFYQSNMSKNTSDEIKQKTNHRYSWEGIGERLLEIYKS